MSKEYVIKVTRLKKVFGFAIPFTLLVDDKEIGSLSNGKSFDCIVTEGMHKVTFKSTEKDVHVDVTLSEEHQKVEIIITAAMGIIAARPNIKEVKYM
jgi:hypothetical protein